MKKKEKENDAFDLIMKEGGWWECKFCSNKNWSVYHRPEDIICDKTGKSREEAEKEEESDRP